MKKLFLLFLLCLLIKLTTAQTFWKYYGYDFHSGTYIFKTFDGGNLILTGTALNFHTAGTLYMQVIKTDFEGNIQWSKLYGAGDSTRCLAYSGLQLNDGGYIIAGSFSSISSQNTDSLSLMRIDSSGNMSWVKVYGIDNSAFPSLHSFIITETYDHGFVLTGNTLLLKTDSSGNVLWMKKYVSMTGPFSPLLRGEITETADSGLIFMGSLGGGPGAISQVSIFKTDQYGNLQWSKNYIDSTNFTLTNIKETTTGYIFTKGEIIIKIDFSGDTLWTKKIDTNNQGFHSGLHFTLDQDKIVFTAILSVGTGAGSDIVSFKIDSSANLIWSRKYLDNSIYKSIHWISNSGNGYAIGGNFSIQAFPTIIQTDSLGFIDCSIDTMAVTFFPTNITITTDSFRVDTLSTSSILATLVSYDSIITGTVCQTTNIDKMEKVIPVIYPNPTKGNIIIQSSTETIEVNIYDLLGNKLMEKVSTHTINLSGFSQGVYLCEIIYESGKRSIHKLIVQQ
jgi:hypothetical protein